MNRIFDTYCSIILIICSVVLPGVGQSHLTWQEWTTLPPNPELEQDEFHGSQPGLAGAYSGMSDGVMIVAGGANFPYDVPWEGGEKVYWDQIYVLKADGQDTANWLSSDVRLPVNMAYGAVVQRGSDVVLIGGENESGVVSEVLALGWDHGNQRIMMRELTPLPDGFKAVSGGLLGKHIVVHGVQNEQNVLVQLGEGNNAKWEVLPGCPGPPRYYPVSQVQSNGRLESLYLFSGRTQDSQGRIELLYDGFRYDPVQREWAPLGRLNTDDAEDLCLMGASSIRSGASHILVFGGDDGRELMGRIGLLTQIEEAQDAEVKVQLQNDLDSLFVNHSGFSRTIRAYHTITNTWTILDTFPGLLPVTTNAFSWKNQYFITSGEIHPGIRTPIIWKGSKTERAGAFGWLNYLVIGLYFLVMIVIGVKYSRRQKSTEDYFKGGGRIPWWAAGLSLFGTSLSAITFMAIPAKTYMTDWGYFFFQMTPLIAAPILIAVYIPYFRRLNITSAYEYLEKRFNLLTRVLGSLSFMVLQLGRVGIVLFLPSIAVSLVTGVSIELCIVVMGVVSIVYTMMGGIEAVIWTDVLQVVVLMGGAALCLVLLLTQVDMALGEAYQAAADAEKFRLLETSFDMTRPTIWVVLIGGFFANLITSGSDQTMVQRYLTTSDEEEARRSVWTFALLAIPATLIFFSIGTALYLYYTAHVEHLDPTLANDDAIFPWYIVTELPQGVSGLLIAGIFSAAMSSLSSSMNSVSTAFITDFYHRFSWGSARSELKMARVATLVFGVLGTGFALMMASWNIQSLWDQFQLYIGLFAGGLGGLFLLGMTTKRANGRGAVAGLILSGMLQYYLTMNTNMHVLLFAATGFVSCYVLSYLFSLIKVES